MHTGLLFIRSTEIVVFSTLSLSLEMRYNYMSGVDAKRSRHAADATVQALWTLCVFQPMRLIRFLVRVFAELQIRLFPPSES